MPKCEMSQATDRAGEGHMNGGKKLRLRWGAACAECGAPLAPGDQAWWFHLEDVGRCLTCVDPPVPTTRAAVNTAATVTKDRPGTDATTRSEEVTPPTSSVRTAGASAQTEYERRRRNDKDRIRRNLPLSVLVVAAAPFVGCFGVKLGAGLLDALFRSLASSAAEGSVDTAPVFDSELVHLTGLVVAVTVTLAAARAAFGPRQSTQAWRIGAEGERLTGRALQKLPSEYRVLHDLPMPRSKANIDHVVVGPTGVFTVETKNYKNGVTIRCGRVYGSGRKLDGIVTQARRQASAVADRTGATVTPIVCVHGGVKLDGWFQKPVVDGVRFCSGRRLTKAITAFPAQLDDATIARIERVLA